MLPLRVVRTGHVYPCLHLSSRHLGAEATPQAPQGNVTASQARSRASKEMHIALEQCMAVPNFQCPHLHFPVLLVPNNTLEHFSR